METRFTRSKSAILERPLSRPKTEVSVSAFALLFSEVVQYCQSRVYSVTELQNRLAELGQRVGASLLDVLVLREKNGKRETKVLNILLFIKVGLRLPVILEILILNTKHYCTLFISSPFLLIFCSVCC